MGEDRTAVVGEAGPPIVARTETDLHLIILPAAIPTGTDTGRRRTDRRGGIRIRMRRHRNKALAGMDGTGGRRRPRRKTMVGPRGLRHADHIAGVLEAVTGRLATLKHTDGEGTAVVTTAVQVVVQGVTVGTAPLTDTAAVGTEVAVAEVSHTMVPREVEGVVVGDAVIYALYILIVKFAD